MPIQENGPAPYAPAERVIKVIEAHRTKGLPPPITLTVIQRAGTTGPLAPRVLKTLKLLDLIDSEGNLTEQFEGLAKAKEAEYPERFAAILRAAYAEVFHYIDPATASDSDIRDQFRTYTPRGQQDRMVALFLGLCEYCGLIPSEAKREDGKAPTKATAPKTKKKATATPKKGPELAPTFQPSPPPSSGQHPFIEGLLQSLPDAGEVWPKAKREAWTKAALATFDLIYELPTNEKEGENS